MTPPAQAAVAQPGTGRELRAFGDAGVEFMAEEDTPSGRLP
jgi:hypothetical protein